MSWLIARIVLINFLCIFWHFKYILNNLKNKTYSSLLKIELLMVDISDYLGFKNPLKSDKLYPKWNVNEIFCE